MKKKIETVIIMALGGGFVSWLILISTTVHIPILVSVLVGMGLGLMQPKWGMYYVLGFFGIVLLSISLLQDQGLVPKEKDVMAFCKYAVIGTSLVAGFIGSLTKKLF